MKVVLIMLCSVFLSSCAKILLPYEESQLCKKGANFGYCGRLSDVYEQTLKEERR
ncbi:MAG: hypothetical protein ACK4SM_06545 [Aquificaceae bacterium]